jgi:hypothetical protein
MLRTRAGPEARQVSYSSEPEDPLGVDDLLDSFRWYNVLCINQNDFNERNHQVQQMADIYRRASRVMSG